MIRTAVPHGLVLLALSAVALAAQEQAPGPLVSGSWLEERVGDPGILVLHVDSRRDEYEAGHIPGARFLDPATAPLLGGASYEAPPIDSLVAVLEAAGVADGVHIVIVSRSLTTATRAWATLDYLGHGGHASILDGGMARWQAEGRPLVAERPADTRGALTPRPRPDVLADADWIAGRLGDAGVALIDGRREDQYTAEEGDMGGRESPGHMPGAAWLGWETLLEPGDAPVLRPLDQLRAMFEDAGADAGKVVVAYCTIGTRASVNYFVGRMLGYDMRLYEGSWHEWSARALPFVSGPQRKNEPGTQGPGPIVQGAWLEPRLGDPGLLVLQIDPRRDGYAAGHIPGSRFIPQSAIALDSDPGYELPTPDSLDSVLEAAGVRDDVHIVITAGSPLAATRLWLTLDWLGHGDHASILDGGMARWQAEARPLASDTGAATRGSFTPRPRTDMLVDADWIAARLDDENVALIDARPDAEYTGEDGGMDGRVHPGHIPGAAQLYWEELIESRQADPSFLPIDTLRATFEAAGAAPGRTVVTYCMVGARASLVYFVGRMLGYDMRFYDGSWHDWGARDLPFVSGRSRR